MKTMMAMTCSILIMVTMMMTVAVLINWLEGDILPDTSPWSFVSSTAADTNVFSSSP